MIDEPTFLASVGYFPERYGNYLMPIALSQLAGKEIPPAVLVNHVMVTKGNVCKYYPDVQMHRRGKDIELQVPAGGFRQATSSTLASQPDLKDFENLVPSN